MRIIDKLFEWLQHKFGVNNMAYFFLLPNLLIFGIFVLFPMVLNIYYSFTGGANLFPQNRSFVGFTNFETLFTCTNFLDPNTCKQDLFWRAVYNTSGFVIFQLFGMIFFSLLTAIILNRNIRARGFFRSVFFYPVLLSPVVVALIWKWILQREGLLNAFMVDLGLQPVQWLLSADWAKFWVIFISVWAYMGFYTLILLAGLQSIPADLYEAASIDGTNSWQSFTNITLPLLMPTIFVVVVLALIRAVQVFDVVFAFTKGGPGTATLFMVQYIYNTGFSNQVRLLGLSSAASVVMGIVLLIFTLIQLRVGQENEAA